MNFDTLLPLVVLLPLLGAVLIGMGGFLSRGFRAQEKLLGGLATLMVAVPFVILAGAFLTHDFAQPIRVQLFSWMSAGELNLNFGYYLDQLSVTMGLIVTGVGALIHLYSIAYMHGDDGYYKYFLYLNLFIFAMLNLVLGDNLIVTFLGWEGVGACSYFLIGYWYSDMDKAAAAQKAFVANRIGDFAYLVAVFLLFAAVGTLAYPELLEKVAAGELPADTGMWVALLFFIAATGKSAQIPLYVWLPDAMAGPTPVSALIHAATMVTSGVYLIARLSTVYLTAPDIMLVVSIVGAATAIIAALIAVTQNDIKKVLAYSTVSQLGFMFMALGAGAFTAAIFHVMTHAFFKACLFLGSGSVIHAMDHTHAVDDPQDIRTMGGLGKYMRSTSTTFWISTLAIAGIPLLSGFFSKDEILGSTFAAGHEHALYYLVWGVGIFTAFLTAFYMTRLSTLTFSGKPRFDATTEGAHAPHESPALMTLPLWVLAALAIVGGYVGIPAVIGHGAFNVFNHGWLGEVVTNRHLHADEATEWGLIALSIAIAVLGMLLGRRFYLKRGVEGDAALARSFKGFYRLAERKFLVDELYNKFLIRPLVAVSQYVLTFFDRFVLDGGVDFFGWTLRQVGFLLGRLQNGVAQSYALLMVVGMLVLVAYLMFG
jgi:NADH-quinone oxidoreductase subunit L